MKYSVAGVLLEKGTVLLARRTGSGSMDGRWELPGGKCEQGEDGPTALRREFLEEFGMDIEVGAPSGHAFFEHKGEKHRVDAFLIRALGRISFLAEHSEVKWFAFDQLPPAEETVDSDFELLQQIPRAHEY